MTKSPDPSGRRSFLKQGAAGLAGAAFAGDLSGPSACADRAGLGGDDGAALISAGPLNADGERGGQSR